MTILRSWSRTTPICPACRHTNKVGDRFCIACGTALPLATQPPQTGGTEGKPPRRRFRRFRRFGIGCGGLLMLLLVVVAVITVVGSIVGTPDDGGQVGVARLQPTPTPESAVRVSPIPEATGNNAAKMPTITPIPIATPTSVPIATPTSVPTATPTPQPIEMELAGLLDEYDKNKVRANTQLRYQENGKVPVSTSGYVSEVEELYVVVSPLQEGYSSHTLYCFYADTRTALDLTKGQRISVTGKVSGTDGYSRQVHMFACEFEGIRYDRNPTVPAQELSRNVVQVYCSSDSLFSSAYRGTGIIMDAQEGTIWTVHHVVADENECERIEVAVPGIESQIPATVVRHCASIDRALLRIAPEPLGKLSLQPIYRAAAPAQTDQEVYFWGYGPGESRKETGIVKDVLGDNIVTDAYAVPGDSGSPVFDEYGHFLGTMSRSNRSDRAVFTGKEC